MQNQLKKLEMDHNIEWQNYRLDELFNNIVQGKRLRKQDQVPGKLPFVMSGVTNTGIVDYVGNDVRVFPPNSLTVDIFGNVFYRNYEYGLGDDTGAYWSTDKNIPKDAMLYISATMQKFFLGKFDYGNKLRSSRSVGFEIQLPTVVLDGKRELAFDFMKQFISMAKAERITTLKAQRDSSLKAYLQATSVNNYDLTPEEQKLLELFSSMKWEMFKISDVLDKLNLKRKKPSFDKLRDTSTYPTTEFTLPLVNAKLGNNGIMFFGRDSDFDSAEMTIDVVSNGAVATGTVYAQPYKTGVLWDAYLLKPKAQGMTKEKLLYLATALQKSIRTKFGWEDKAVWSKVKNEYISLPVKVGNQLQPDYELMERLIAIVQKVVIKEVVELADKKINITANIVSEPAQH